MVSGINKNEMKELGKSFLAAFIKGVQRITSPKNAVWIIRILLITVWNLLAKVVGCLAQVKDRQESRQRRDTPLLTTPEALYPFNPLTAMSILIGGAFPAAVGPEPMIWILPNIFLQHGGVGLGQISYVVFLILAFLLEEQNSELLIK